jgi:hypothetical protein
MVVFVVRGGQAIGRSLPMAPGKLRELATRLRERIERRDIRYTTEARALYAALLQPVEDLLPRRGRLTLIPDGFLWNLPFDVLENRAGVPMADGLSRPLARRPSRRRARGASPRRAVWPGRSTVLTGAAARESTPFMVLGYDTPLAR